MYVDYIIVYDKKISLYYSTNNATLTLWRSVCGVNFLEIADGM
jgi:hypothetical protein